MSQTSRGESASLVAAAAAGDRGALEDLWRSRRRWVAAIILAHMPRDADLEDLLQEVGAKLVAKIGDLRSEEAFTQWLRIVAINTARTAGRKHQRRNGVLRRFTGRINGTEPEAAAEAGGRSNGPSTAAREEGSRLLELARQLPDGYAEPLLLRCLNDMSYREIGAALGLPETTVETRIARGRRMLRELAKGKGLVGVLE